MTQYIGIDLGTTNSAISSYDGVNAPRVWKSPEQNDVTPSAIYIGRRGNRYYGHRAYEAAARDEQNTAVLFKRYMGTNNKFDFKDAGISLTPEECSAEILKILFGYLPDEIRNTPDVATVITVPAAFNQVKKEATLNAAQMAGLGKVALMQEPVAAIMSVMRGITGKRDGIFLVYDLGGGTFDVSIAESRKGKVNLLTQHGREMCGGRDWDRRIFNNIIVTWLKEHFSLPDDFIVDEEYRKMCRSALFSAERAKMELSSKENTFIQSDELNCNDMDGKEIYLDIPFSRSELNLLIDDIIDETIETTLEAMKKSGLTSSDIESLVFVGGPTNYSYLRQKIASELAIKTESSENSVNPMTAVAEGASIFAESIDWSNERHDRKPVNADVSVDKDFAFRYESRVSGNKARVIFRVDTNKKLFIELTSSDTGWISGRLELINGTQVELPLSKDGENIFKVKVYDEFGRIVPIPEEQILITKTLATVGAIPASHSIGVTALDKIGGTERLVYLIRKDDSLPKKGRISFKAAQTLKAGTGEPLIFKIWEGEIEYPYTDNRFVGAYKIAPSDLNSGDIIPTGSELICDYEISDAGNIFMGVSVPCLGTDFGRKNCYDPRDGELNIKSVEKVANEGRAVISRIDELSQKIDDPRLDKAREKAEKAASLDSKFLSGEEEIQEADSALHETKEILAQIRRDHLKEIRQMELDFYKNDFEQNLMKHAESSEVASFNNVARTAQRFLDRNDPSFEQQMEELKNINLSVLVRQDWFIIGHFDYMTQNSDDYIDKKRFEELKRAGLLCVKNDDIKGLRSVIKELYEISRSDLDSDGRLRVNIIGG